MIYNLDLHIKLEVINLNSVDTSYHTCSSTQSY